MVDAASSLRTPTWRDWLVVVACLGCQVGMGVGAYLWPVFLGPVTQELDWSRTEYAQAAPIMGIAVACVGPAVGWFSDRISPRPVLISGAFVMSGMLVAAASMSELWHLYLAAIGIGVGIACLGDLPTGAAITSRFQRWQGVAFGSVYVGSNLGGFLGALVANELMQGGTWRDALQSIGGGLWMFVLPLALFVTVRRRPASTGAHDAPAIAADVARVDEPLWRRTDFWLLFWVLFAFYLYRLGVNNHLVAHLTDQGYSAEEARMGWAWSLFAGVIGKLATGFIADRIGVRATVLGIFVLIAVASMLLLLPATPLVVRGFLTLHGVVTPAEDVVMPLLVAARFGAGNLGRAYGLLMLAMIPGAYLGPVLAGLAFDELGSYTTAFWLFTGCNVLGVAALISVGRRPAPRH